MNKTRTDIIKALQDGLPLSKEPYRELAERLGISEDELLAQLRLWREEGIIRRFGVVLNHNRAGFTENAMCAWNVPQNQIDGFACKAVEIESVSHCYQRSRFEGFDLNIYTMIHGRTRDDCRRIAEALSKSTGVADYLLLFTREELKKSAPRYFLESSDMESTE